MKSCPVCGDNYSERIDFCFGDGAVLVLVPSAMDAPIPRMPGARAGELAVPGLGAEASASHRAPVAPSPTPIPASNTPAEPAPSPPLPSAVAAATPALPIAPPIEDAGTTPDSGPLPADPTLDDAWLADDTPTTSAPAIPASEVRTVAAPPPAPAAEPRSKSGWVLALVVLLFAAGAFAYVVGMDAPAPAPTPQVVQPKPPEPPEPPKPVAAAEPVEPPPIVEAVVEPAPVEAAPVRAEAVRSAPPKPAPTSAPRSGVTVRNEPIAPPVRNDVTVRNEPITPAPQPQPRVDPAPAPITPSASNPWGAPETAQEATLTLTSVPSGAVVRVDGRLIGKTPGQARVPFGAHVIEFQLDGYRTETRRADVRSDSLSIPVELVAITRIGPAVIAAPGWEGAVLRVDGKEVGRIPIALQISEGLHEFHLQLGDRVGSERKVVQLLDKGSARVVLAP